uniref:CHAT domain-containing protein n=1 Tax=Candidatus Kentrum sp. FM TaxID=2126340 RepID=A0A450TLK2_9GAMM|nr:MAG: CHAT domain-containing protein [Candidatus Kentron sp. FM]VFJ68596.1 MAG: CHAT domain-containing protein [Candidatus Kentron sp. FM]VFK17665.1 MAG: CHAT domain-containing protein [Candidatus Kentron sp. FM]
MPKDYRLLITGPKKASRKDAPKDGAASYRAQWRDGESRLGAPFAFTPPFQKKQLEELRWYLEEYIQFPGAGDRVRAAKLEQNLDQWGRALFHAAFAGDKGAQVYGRLMDGARDKGTATLTIASTDPAVLAQPWELMQAIGPPEERNRRASPAALTVRRQLQETKTLPRYDFQPPLRILLVVARPKDAPFIDPRNSIPPILDAVETLPGQVAVDFCEPPTLAELERRLHAAKGEGRPYHIVHFDGHSAMMEIDVPKHPVTEVGVLWFENDACRIDLVPGIILGKPLVENHVPVVILEACRGAYLSDQPVHASVAPALLQSGVANVVAFSYSVHIDAARILVECFYRELVKGASLGRAVESARAALGEHPERWLSYGPDAETIDLVDWFIPQLYQVGEDSVLLSPGGDDAALRTQPAGLMGRIFSAWKRRPRRNHEGPGNAGEQKRPRSPIRDSRFEILDSFPPPPQYRFHGRAPELLELERAFRQHPAVLLHAMGGMGKTALAREAAHWWLRKGTIRYAVFHSFERLAGAERVVQVLGQALMGNEFNALPAGEQPEQGEQWRRAVELFHQQPVLLVWDNFESTLAQWNAALQGGFAGSAARRSGSSNGIDSTAALESGAPGDEDTITGFSAESRQRLQRLYRDLTDPRNGQSPKGKLLITCRPGDTGLSVPHEAKIELQGLAPPDALYLLRAVMKQKAIDPERPGYERFQIDDLLKMLAWQPLAIELVTPHLKELTPEQIRTEFAQHLERFTDPTHPEERNQSLLASLDFSVRRLSLRAKAVFPLLGWFRGGVFEDVLLAFMGLEPESWAGIRKELVVSGLIQTEELSGFNTLYIKLHPSLPFAAQFMPIQALTHKLCNLHDKKSIPILHGYPTIITQERTASDTFSVRTQRYPEFEEVYVTT